MERETSCTQEHEAESSPNRSRVGQIPAAQTAEKRGDYSEISAAQDIDDRGKRLTSAFCSILTLNQSIQKGLNFKI